MFSAASQHPAVTAAATISAEELDEANKTMAEMVMRLLTESCKDETQKALQYEGQVTIQTSFEVLGQVAGNEMFSSPEVASALSGMEKHLDESRLRALMQTE
jgi:hypothetical protein